MNKNDLRLEYKSIRHSIENKESKSFDAFKLLEGYLKDIEYNSISVFYSFQDEIDTRKIIEEELLKEKTVLIPKVIDKTDMMMVQIKSLEDLNQKNSFGIKEPSLNESYNEKIDIVIIPGIVFDMLGNRIGYGKGYYDKYLQNKNPIKIGYCFDEQVSIDLIKTDENDVKMDMIITEKRLIKI